MTAHPFVSVIVPVYNDPERLRLCLRALEGQTYPESRYEIVVMDNGAGGGARSMLASFLLPVRYARALWRDPKLGSPRERGKAVSVALFVCYVQAWEKLRLALGGDPRR